MSTSDISINRDHENDVIYVFDERFDRSKTMHFSLNADILLRVDPKTKKIIGLTIESFSEIMPHFNDLQDYHLKEKFDSILEFLNAAPAAFEKKV